MTPRPAIVFSDLDPVYPQPVLLALSLAGRTGETILIDNFGAHRVPATRAIAPVPATRRMNRLSLARSHARFLRAVARENPSVVVAVNETLIAPLAAARALGPRDCVFGLYLLDYWEDDPVAKPLRLRAGHAAARLFGRRFDFVVDCEPERLARRTWLGGENEGGPKRFILRNSPMASDVPPRGRPSDATNSARARPKLIYAGAGHRGVCLEALFEALALVEEPVEVSLRLRCSPERLDEVRRAASAVPPRHSVRAEGEIPKPELLRELAGSDIAVCFYRYDDAMNLNTVLCSPNKAYEAIACGVALLASANPTLRFVEERGVGAYVDPQSPASVAAGLKRLLAGRAFEEAGRRARAWFEDELSHERQVEPILNAIAELTRAKGARR